ncbi:MAG TPA: extensin family protein [Xanthobacteraceae bacterium]|nr:extensin family protein [Xanthobacteraceae bacterium]
MRLCSSLFALFLFTAPGLADDAPLPRPRPPEAEQKSALPVEIDPLEREAALKLCEEFTRADVAVATPLDPMAWDNGCTAAAPVSMSAIKFAKGQRVELKPAAVLRCPTALVIARWVREDLEPLADKLGSRIERIDVAASFGCRPRNSVFGAVMSEHGKANALDIWALHLADGRRIGIQNADGPLEFLAGMRQSACVRFTTVLGPGADKDHETHLHVDLAERRNGYRICQWTLPDPEKPSETVETGAQAAGKKAEKDK